MNSTAVDRTYSWELATLLILVIFTLSYLLSGGNFQMSVVTALAAGFLDACWLKNIRILLPVAAGIVGMLLAYFTNPFLFPMLMVLGGLAFAMKSGTAYTSKLSAAAAFNRRWILEALLVTFSFVMFAQGAILLGVLMLAAVASLPLVLGKRKEYLHVLHHWWWRRDSARRFL